MATNRRIVLELAEDRSTPLFRLSEATGLPVESLIDIALRRFLGGYDPEQTTQEFRALVAEAISENRGLLERLR